MAKTCLGDWQYIGSSYRRFFKSCTFIATRLTLDITKSCNRTLRYFSHKNLKLIDSHRKKIYNKAIDILVYLMI